MFYNFTGFISPRFAIKIDSIFSVIREINEILSLTNEPDKLANTALDTLSQTLNIECCWIQTISDRKNQKLSLAADRGFSDAMRAEIISMDLKHKFSGEVIGMGNKIIIPDLNNDGAYGLASLRTAGYKWLVAVPLMTYRVYGLLGAACRNKKTYDKDTPELIMVVGGLIANALSKAELTSNFQRPVKAAEPAMQAAADPVAEPASGAPAQTSLPAVILIPGPLQFTSQPEISNDVSPAAAAAAETFAQNPLPVTAEKPAVSLEAKNPQKPADPVFYSHTRKMESFRKTHRKS